MSIDVQINDQRRKFSRVLFEAGATLSAGRSSFACTLHDLSLKGALLTPESPQSLALGEKCLLDLRLGDAAAEIRMEGSIAHLEGTQVGLRCDSIDIDSLTHLRRLVELNVGDEAILQRELSALTAE